MNKKLFSLILAFAIMLGAISSFASCNNDEISTESTAVENTDTEDTDGSDTEESSETESETESDTPEILYENGEEIKSAGAQWGEDIFAARDNVIDESVAVDKTADEIIALLTDKKAMKEGEVYRVTEPLVLESDTKYYGNLAAVIAEGGIIIKDVSEIVIKELIVKGSITIENSAGITFFKTDAQGDAIGVSIDEKSSDVSFKNCKVTASDVAIDSKADTVSVYRTYLCAKSGILSVGDDLVIQDSKIVATDIGVSSLGKYCTVRESTLEVASDGMGVNYKSGSYNGLIALNVIKNAQTSVKVADGYNCVVLLNSAVSIMGDDSTNLYVVENKLGGRISLNNNKYLLCEGNTFIADGNDHAVISSGNTEINGNNIQDVNARVQYGANEEILPHTNKDLFIDMERRDTVRDISQTKTYGVSGYVRAMAQSEQIVILSPGVYSTDVALSFDTPHSNTSFYGYGVYIERNGRDLNVNSGAVSQNGIILNINNSTNFTVKGLTVGYNFQSAGQIYVLDKVGGNKLRVIGNAGYINDFALTDPSNFAKNTYVYAAGELCPYDSNINFSVVKNADGTVERDEDGAFLLQLSGSASSVTKLYSKIKTGDILACRLSGDNSRTVNLTGCKNVFFKDFVLYGYSSALGIVAASRASGIKLERVHNTAQAQPVIDKSTYDKYKSLEDSYGIDLEVSIDEEGRYRGGIPRVGSVDATHINGASEGVSATSCLFEQMCDDGSNQRASSSRIAGYHVNDDGTTTIYYKGTISQTYWERDMSSKKTTSTPTNCSAIELGDRIYAYASNGRVLFDTTALTKGALITSAPMAHISHVDKLVNSEIEDGDVIDINGVYDRPSGCTDGLCDVCGAVTHYDSTRDGKCDFCNKSVHVDRDRNNKCDVTSCSVSLADENGDHINDDAKNALPIVTDTFYVSQFSTLNGKYNVTGSYVNGSWYNIVYNTYIYQVKVKTSDINFDAFEGYNLADNEYIMDNKILIDNLSANSVGFTFDNVLIQNKNARGILCKTHDATIKNCTFRGFVASGILLSVETTWGESTVPRNIVIEGCLFDDTGRNINTESYFNYAGIVIQGLGANGSSDIEVSENSLPCRDIKITGNKFTNCNNNYAITVSAAQNIVIKDNVFEARSGDTEKKYGRALYIDGAMNIEISGNTYSKIFDGDVSKMIVAWNYENLHGSDVDGIIPDSNGPAGASN